jgi:conjugative relaxase-like TrwC/TraI family protein
VNERRATGGVSPIANAIGHGVTATGRLFDSLRSVFCLNKKQTQKERIKMITVKEQKNAASASTYFDEHLTRDDYYTKDDPSPGKWFGKLAREFNLSGAVEKESFDHLASGFNPEDGTKLTERLRKNRNAFFDFTCSAPKSVSIVGLIVGDKRVVKCHQEASLMAMDYLERAACVRVRQGADVLTTKRAYTGKIVAAHFDHEASRSLDCQLHRHYCVFNVTKGADGALKALDARRMYDRSKTATEVYRNELAKGLLHLGYDLRPTAKGFEIEGISPNMLDRFSKRQKKIAGKVAEREAALERKLSQKERSAIVQQTRDKKVSLSPDDLLARWQGQLTKPEKKELVSLVRHADRSKSSGRKISEPDLIAAALARETKGKRVAGHEVLRRCLVTGRGKVDVDKLEKALFTPRNGRVHNPEVPFRSFGRGNARVGVSLHLRGYSPSLSKLVFRCLALAVREMDQSFETIEIFR